MTVHRGFRRRACPGAGRVDSRALPHHAYRPGVGRMADVRLDGLDTRRDGLRTTVRHLMDAFQGGVREVVQLVEPLSSSAWCRCPRGHRVDLLLEPAKGLGFAAVGGDPSPDVSAVDVTAVEAALT